MPASQLDMPIKTEESVESATDAEEQPRSRTSRFRIVAVAASALGLVAMAGAAVGVFRGRAGSAAEARDVVRLAGGSPCFCETWKEEWVKCERTWPQCVFIDLGAADGNTFEVFRKNGYGAVDKCPSGQWEAHLVEANPHFDDNLNWYAKWGYPGKVHAYPSTAAYACDGQTSFFIDTVNTEHNFWGSTMSTDNPNAYKSNHVSVTVPLLNLNKILYEQTTPGDYVIVKMDIEGAEWDILPCLAKAPGSWNIDRLLMEVHPREWGVSGTSQELFDQAKATLRSQGTDIPPYNSATK